MNLWQRATDYWPATLVESVMFAVFAYLPEFWMTEDFHWCNSVRIVEIHRTVNIKPYDGVDHPAIHQRTANARILFFHVVPPRRFMSFELSPGFPRNTVLLCHDCQW